MTDDDWQPRPAIFPGEWLDEETSAQVVREFDDLRRQTMQPGDNGNRRPWLVEEPTDILGDARKAEQQRKIAEMALSDMRRKYWEGQGVEEPLK